jgi:hypothetical protein
VRDKRWLDFKVRLSFQTITCNSNQHFLPACLPSRQGKNVPTEPRHRISILSVFGWNINIGKDKIPRVWKAQAKVNMIPRLGTVNRSIRSWQARRACFSMEKGHFSKSDCSLVVEHGMTICAFLETHHVTKQMNG